MFSVISTPNQTIQIQDKIPNPNHGDFQIPKTLIPTFSTDPQPPMATPTLLPPSTWLPTRFQPLLTQERRHFGSNLRKEKWVLLNSVRCGGGMVDSEVGKEKVEYLVRESGWRVRKMALVESEMRSVAYVQAEAFHVPVLLFDDFFFQFFQAEVLAALFYKIRNSPSDRYACLVAEPMDASNIVCTSMQGLVGVVDLTAQNDYDVVKHLDGAEEYLYVSGIAVLKEYRRKKVATALLKACEALSITWGFGNLALRAYEDDLAARKLYTNAGYQVVSRDPKWSSTWIGKRRRVLMVKSN